MKIFLGSTNISKYKSVEIAAKELKLKKVKIKMVDAKSNVSSKPKNEETLQGAINRNNYLKNYCRQTGEDYDLLISIEGGFEQVLDKYFIVTYAVIDDKNGNQYVGKSEGLQITSKMFNWTKDGQSLNTVIENIQKTEDNKKNNGISGYLTSGYYKRCYFESSAVISALQAMNNWDSKYLKLESEVEKTI